MTRKRARDNRELEKGLRDIAREGGNMVALHVLNVPRVLGLIERARGDALAAALLGAVEAFLKQGATLRRAERPICLLCDRPLFSPEAPALITILHADCELPTQCTASGMCVPCCCDFPSVRDAANAAGAAYERRLGVRILPPFSREIGHA